MTIGFKKRGSLARDRTYLIMHACPRHPPIPRAAKKARTPYHDGSGAAARAARSERLSAKPAPALFGDDPSGSSLSEATRRGRAWRWRPRRGRGAKGSNGMGDLTHGLMRARTMLRKSKAKNCEDRLERVARLATGSCAGGRLAGVHGVFFLITVLKLLETSTDHFIFNVSEVQLFCFQIFKQDSCV